jgi:flagellar FliJ protein
MSTLKGVLLAIEHATLQRDVLAKAVSRVERNLEFARAQMSQLQGYAADTDTRWTGTAMRGVSVELMRHQYQFMDRLQQAIAMQSGVLAQSTGQLDAGRGSAVGLEPDFEDTSDRSTAHPKTAPAAPHRRICSHAARP